MWSEESIRGIMKVLQRFELVEVVAEGPRGTLHRARDLEFARAMSEPDERPVAVKVMPIDAVPEGWVELQRRLARAYHPALVPILGVGDAPGDVVFLATPWAEEARDLAHWLASNRAPMEPQEAVAVAVQLAEALAVCHREGIVHMGLKPSNVLLVEGAGEAGGVGAFVRDFGLLPEFSQAAWLAPELLHGGLGTVRSDLYGLAALVVAMVSGKNPAGGSLDQEVELPERLEHGDDWDADVEAFVGGLKVAMADTLRRALSPNPAQRHLTLGEFVKELEASCFASSGVVVREVSERSAGSGAAWAKMSQHPSGVDVRDGLVQEVLVQAETPKKQPMVRFFLRHRDEGGFWGRSGVFFYNGGSVDEGLTYRTLSIAWEGAELSLYDAMAVRKGERQFYTGHDATLPILQPYFPVAVTTVINSEGCASRYLTDLRDGGASNQYLVLGRIVHDMLEALAVPRVGDEASSETAGGPPLGSTDPRMGPGFDALFDAALRRSRLDVLAAGLDAIGLDKLRKTAHEHYVNILEVATRSRTNPFRGAFTEVTRYSGAYGLEGRLDLVFDDGEAFHILELKTGRPRERDQKQVRCYALLWDQLGQSMQRDVVGEVLYSKGAQTVAVQRDQHRRDRRIIKARNEVVALHRQLAYGDTPFEAPSYMENPRECRHASCRYRATRCEFQSHLLGLGDFGDPKRLEQRKSVWRDVDPELVHLGRAYYRRFVRFVEAEYWTATESLGELLRVEKLPQRLQKLEALGGLRVGAVDVELGRVTFLGEDTQIMSKGSSVIAHRGDFHSGPILTGYVRLVEDGVLVVESPGASAMLGLEPEGWIIDKPPVRIGHRSSHRALFDLMRSRDAVRLGVLLKRTVPPLGAAMVEPWTPTSAALGRLNPSQREAVNGALAGHAAYLIQGPPGTGKTTVIAAIVMSLIERGKRVLLAAGTNTAVDNVLKRLVEHGFMRFLRLGHRNTSDELAALLERRGHDPALWFARDLGATVSDLDDLHFRIRETPIVAGTTYRASSSPVIEILERAAGHTRNQPNTGIPKVFDVAIIDEASQITEPMMLGAINRAERFVLVGDHRQLPPIVTSDQALGRYQQARLLREQAQQLTEPTPLIEHQRRYDRLLEEVGGVRGLDQSLFERLTGHVPSTRLVTQYRMNRDIMAFSSSMFYDSTLQAADEVAGLRLPVHTEALARLKPLLRAALDPARPLVLIDIRSEQTAPHQNQAEADVALELLEALLQPGLIAPRKGARPFDPDTTYRELGVISPFRAQVQLINRLIAERLPNKPGNIDVDTVERFQGGEKEVIVASFVTSSRQSAFVADPRRLNVTLTRAKSKLIVLGNLRTLATTSELFRKLIELPEAHILHHRAKRDA